MDMSRRGSVVAVNRSASHSFSKLNCESILLLAGQGVEGDAHCGVTVQHRSRVAQNPDQPNLRQVHLIQSELFLDLAATGFAVLPGQMGENITTTGLDLLCLPTGSRLHVGSEAVLEVTGLRNPCSQLDNFKPGLMAAVVGRAEDGGLIRKAGVMAVVTVGGLVRPGDEICLELPPLPHVPLDRV